MKKQKQIEHLEKVSPLELFIQNYNSKQIQRVEENTQREKIHERKTNKIQSMYDKYQSFVDYAKGITNANGHKKNPVYEICIEMFGYGAGKDYTEFEEGFIFRGIDRQKLVKELITLKTKIENRTIKKSEYNSILNETHPLIGKVMKRKRDLSHKTTYSAIKRENTLNLIEWFKICPLFRKTPNP